MATPKRSFLDVLASPAGNWRWRQHPQARMSWLSVIAAFGLAATLIVCLILKYAGMNLDGPVLTVTLMGGFGLVFLSGAADNHRDRRR